MGFSKVFSKTKRPAPLSASSPQVLLHWGADPQQCCHGNFSPYEAAKARGHETFCDLARGVGEVVICGNCRVLYGVIRGFYVGFI